MHIFREADRHVVLIAHFNFLKLQFLLLHAFLISEISQKVQKKDDELNSKEHEIKELEKKLKEQQIKYQKRLGDAEIQRKQDQYIAKVMEKQDKKAGYTQFERPKSQGASTKSGSAKNTWR